MNISQEELDKALKELQNNFPDLYGNNKKSIGASIQQKIEDKTYERCSMKRSRFQNLDYSGCKFSNVAFTASSFHHIRYEDTLLEGNSFACCNFFDCTFSKSLKKNILYLANNFSQSNFTKSTFYGVTFKSSGFLQTLFYNCTFENTLFQSNTLEGTCFSNCSFKNVKAGKTNVEFIELLNSQLENVEFPFYQFAYIIGASHFLKEDFGGIFFRVGNKKIDYNEYKSQINNLILFYADNQEYFPICNLLIATDNIKDAQSAFLSGINQALDNLDFRMIRHFCRLAKRHDLLDDFTIRRANKTLENYLLNETVPPERINDFIINAGEIRQILLSGKSDSVIYNFKIQTNVSKKDKDGLKYVNSLSNEINQALSQYDLGQLGFQVAVSNHSPFEIVVDVICASGGIATIAQMIWAIVDRTRTGKESDKVSFLDNYMAADKAMYEKYIDNRIELCKQQLLNLKNNYTEKKMNHYIEEITQQLKTDISELYSKDIMIFKKKNSDKI